MGVCIYFFSAVFLFVKFIYTDQKIEQEKKKKDNTSRKSVRDACTDRASGRE